MSQPSKPTPLILIVEDDDEVRILLRDILEHDGYRVEMAANGFEGLQAVRQQMPNLVLTDLAMPEMDGAELIRVLRRESATKHLPIIILSGVGGGVNNVVKGLELGADDYIMKPFHYLELRARIRSRLRIQEMERKLTAMKALQRRTEELEGILEAIAAKNIRIQQKSIFISYRRSSSMHLARLIFQDLQSNSFDVFLDVDALDGGVFDQVILNQIAARAHFVIVLSPGCLARCADEHDWVRREIAEAVRLKRNIIPVYDEGFQSAHEKEYLPEPLRTELFRCNAVPYSHFHAKSSFEALRRFLNESVHVPLTATPVDELAEVQERIEKALKTLRRPVSEFNL